MALILHLPLAAPNLVSRDKEVAYLTAQLTGETRLLTIVGPGGVGKTHLAIQAAWQLQVSFERIVFVDVSSVEVSQFTAVLLQALEQTTSDKDSFGQLCYALLQKRTLLVLDNFETVLEAAPVVSQLLAHCSSLVILVTSRSQLGLRPETCMPLQPLSAAPQDAPALHFFIACAKTMNPPYALEEHSDDIYKLCQRLDGLPLALELAAACVPFMTPKALLEHLEQHASLPQLVLPDRPERQQNLVALVGSSLSLLSEGEQAFFRRLSVMVGSFSSEAAEAVTDAKALGLETLSTLIKLRNHSLLTSELTSPPRFKMLETIRAVALEFLSNDAEEFAATRIHHLRYYRTFADEHKDKLLRIRDASTLEIFARERGNFRVALDWASQHRDVAQREQGVYLASSLTMFWTLEGQSAEARRSLEKLRGNYSATLQAKWLYALAIPTRALGDIKEALELAKECLRLARVLDDKPFITKTFNLLGNIYLDLNEFAKALEHFESSAVLSEKLGDAESLEVTLINKGLAHKHLGHYDKAQHYYEAALASAKQRQNLRGQALCLNNLALCFGEKDPARLQHLEEAHRLFYQIGEKRNIAMTLNNLATVVHSLGQQERGTVLMQEGLALSKQIGDRYLVALTLLNLGCFASESHDHAAADQYLLEGLELARAINNRWIEGNALVQYSKSPKFDTATAAKHQLTALEFGLELQLWDIIVMALDALANLEVTEQRYERAVMLWHVAKKLDARYQLYKDVTDEVLEKSQPHLSPECIEVALQRGEAIKLQELYLELSNLWGNHQQKSKSDVLSKRQMDILKLVAEGHSSKKMAKVFGLSEATIKYHLKEIFDKLAVNSRAEAVAQASQRGLL